MQTAEMRKFSKNESYVQALEKNLEEKNSEKPIASAPAKSSLSWKLRFAQELGFLLLAILIFIIVLPLMWLTTLLFQAFGIRTTGFGVISALIGVALFIIVSVLAGIDKVLERVVVLQARRRVRNNTKNS